MAYDHDMHELATRYPEAVLALLGCTARSGYTVEGIAVKRSERRIDLVFQPCDPLDPTIYVEWQMHAAADIERRMLAEVATHCLQTGRFEPVDIAIVYPAPQAREAALPADVGHAQRRAIAFEPRRVILTQVPPEALLAAGGPALVALPLVGPEERVREEAHAWLVRARAEAGDPQAVGDVQDTFLKLLAWRLGKMVVEELKGLEGVMEETATGQALLKRGEERGAARGRVEGRADECRRAITLVVTARFGVVPEWLPAQLEAEADLVRLEELLRAAAVAQDPADLRRK
ncbi:MAG: DUF2887 domain-containing protein [Planctomycetes bacterium]|nr:DUF2887 domain-containing protein [Planctomycetota bacterium]